MALPEAAGENLPGSPGSRKYGSAYFSAVSSGKPKGEDAMSNIWQEPGSLRIWLGSITAAGMVLMIILQWGSTVGKSSV